MDNCAAGLWAAFPVLKGQILAQNNTLGINGNQKTLDGVIEKETKSRGLVFAQRQRATGNGASGNSSERRPHYVNPHHLWINGLSDSTPTRSTAARMPVPRRAKDARLALSKTRISI